MEERSRVQQLAQRVADAADDAPPHELASLSDRLSGVVENLVDDDPPEPGWDPEDDDLGDELGEDDE